MLFLWACYSLPACWPSAGLRVLFMSRQLNSLMPLFHDMQCLVALRAWWVPAVWPPGSWGDCEWVSADCNQLPSTSLTSLSAQLHPPLWAGRWLRAARLSLRLSGLEALFIFRLLCKVWTERWKEPAWRGLCMPDCLACALALKTQGKCERMGLI